MTLSSNYLVWIPNIGWIDANNQDLINYCYTGISAFALLVSSLVLVVMLNDRKDKTIASHRELIVYMLKEVTEQIAELQIMLSQTEAELIIVRGGDHTPEQIAIIEQLINSINKVLNGFEELRKNLLQPDLSAKRRAEVEEHFIAVTGLFQQIKSSIRVYRENMRR